MQASTPSALATPAPRAAARASAMERLRTETLLVSGSSQWAKWQAAQQLAVCGKGANVRLTIQLSGGAGVERTVTCSATRPPREARPDSIAELEPGIWYVDLTRVQMSDVTGALPSLVGAAGIVFDVRGYPTDVGFRILPHLVASAHDPGHRWMHVSKLVGPFGEIAGWE